MLDFLFELQNPPNPAEALNVVILSGDIHTPGYSTIYSAEPNHQAKAVIPHIVASPVAYTPSIGWAKLFSATSVRRSNWETRRLTRRR